MNKLLKLNSLSCYWNPNENLFLCQKTEQKDLLYERMRNLILWKNYDLQISSEYNNPIYILNISADFKLTQNNEKEHNTPLYILKVNLNYIDIELDK